MIRECRIARSRRKSGVIWFGKEFLFFVCYCNCMSYILPKELEENSFFTSFRNCCSYIKYQSRAILLRAFNYLCITMEITHEQA
jgi:hypothetical protein